MLLLVVGTLLSSSWLVASSEYPGILRSLQLQRSHWILTIHLHHGLELICEYAKSLPIRRLNQFHIFSEIFCFSFVPSSLFLLSFWNSSKSDVKHKHCGGAFPILQGSHTYRRTSIAKEFKAKC